MCIGADGGDPATAAAAAAECAWKCKGRGMKKLPGPNGVAADDLQKSIPKAETGGQLRGALSC